jgi:hypothetical protein
MWINVYLEVQSSYLKLGLPLHTFHLCDVSQEHIYNWNSGMTIMNFTDAKNLFIKIVIIRGCLVCITSP